MMLFALVFFLRLLAPAPSILAQQAGTAVSTPPTCTDTDLDDDVQFVSGPGDIFTVAFNMHNISGQTCVLQGRLRPIQLYPDRASGAKSFDVCMDCEDKFPTGKGVPEPPVLINPGDFAHESAVWKTASSDPAVHCFKPLGVDGPVRVMAPSLLRQVCSEIDIGWYEPGYFKSVGSQIPVAQKPLLDLSSTRTSYYQQESFSLHVALSDPSTALAEDRCPTLFLRQRFTDGGSTSLDEVHPESFKGCRQFVPGYAAGDWRSGFEIDAEANRTWAGVGGHTFQVFKVVPGDTDSPVRFSYSNVLRIQIKDEASVPRRWGAVAEGIAVDVSTEGESFPLGEDVPLHLAVENVDAPVPIVGPTFTWDPCSVVNIEVRDASGKILPPNERFQSQEICTGHGLTLAYPKGGISTSEQTLGETGWLPNHPGTYTIVVTWSPFSGSDVKPASGVFSKAIVAPYATAKDTATIRIFENGASGVPVK